MTVEELETALLGLLKGEHSSLHLTFNDDAGPNYMTVRQTVEESSHFAREWISDDERQKAMDTNRMWSLQWYPDTPIGFYSLSASSLPALIQHVLNDAAVKPE